MKSSQSFGYLLAPVSGVAVPLSDLPDPAFAEGMLGDGVAIDPEDGRFCSPCKGKVVGVTDTAHAYNLLSDDGLELLLHIGIDTVELKGEGFSPKVAVGDHVKAGDVLCEADIHFIREKGYDITSPAVVSNMDEVKKYKFNTGFVTGGKIAVIEYTL